MAIVINKARALKVLGLDDVSIPAPVAEWDRMQNNRDGTITVIVMFYKDQATYDAGDDAFDTHSYQVNSHPNVDTYLKGELAKIAEFDQAV